MRGAEETAGRRECCEETATHEDKLRDEEREISGTRHGEFALPTDRNVEPRETHRAGNRGVGDRRRDGGSGAKVLQDGRGSAREVQPGNRTGGRVHGVHGGRGSDRSQERDHAGGSEEKESGGGDWH